MGEVRDEAEVDFIATAIQRNFRVRWRNIEELVTASANCRRSKVAGTGVIFFFYVYLMTCAQIYTHTPLLYGTIESRVRK